MTTRVPIKSDADVVTARQTAREAAGEAGFSGSDLTVIATATSELARNILEYAQSGEIAVSLATDGPRRAIVVVASDAGPGIADVSLALTDGYSTAKSLGIGLPGARRLMDDFEIVSEVGKGTTITARKWLRYR